MSAPGPIRMYDIGTTHHPDTEKRVHSFIAVDLWDKEANVSLVQVGEGIPISQALPPDQAAQWLQVFMGEKLIERARELEQQIGWLAKNLGVKKRPRRLLRKPLIRRPDHAR